MSSFFSSPALFCSLLLNRSLHQSKKLKMRNLESKGLPKFRGHQVWGEGSLRQCGRVWVWGGQHHVHCVSFVSGRIDHQAVGRVRLQVHFYTAISACMPLVLLAKPLAPRHSYLNAPKCSLGIPNEFSSINRDFSHVLVEIRRVPEAFSKNARRSFWGTQTFLDILKDTFWRWLKMISKMNVSKNTCDTCSDTTHWRKCSLKQQVHTYFGVSA